MNFKDMVAEDVKNVFLNPDEFGEEHEIDGEKIMVIVDNNEQIEREKRVTSHANGVYMKSLRLIYQLSCFCFLLHDHLHLSF